MRGHCLILLVAIAPCLWFANSQVNAAAPGDSTDSLKARWSEYGIPDGREPSGTSCGLNSVYTALRALRVDASYDAIQAQMPTGIYGNTMTQIVNCLRQYPGVEVIPLNCDAQQLARHLRKDRSSRAIVNLIDHWVLARRATGDALEIVDFPKKYFMPIDVLDTQWDGYAVIVRHTGILTHRAILGSGVTLLCILGIVAIAIRGGRIHRWKARVDRGQALERCASTA